MESLCHQYSSFLTLTYSDQHLPEYSSLKKKDLQDFLKRLRHHFPRSMIRYFFSGEYGTKSGRPHYHGVLFGIPPTALQHGSKALTSGPLPAAWKIGFTTCSPLTRGRASYVAKYTTKDQRVWITPGTARIPEFSIQSREPRLGFPYLPYVADALRRVQALPARCGRIDPIPGMLRVGGKMYPLDPACKDELRRLLGVVKREPSLGTRLAFDMESMSHLLLGDPKVEAREKSFKRAERRVRLKEIREAV